MNEDDEVDLEAIITSRTDEEADNEEFDSTIEDEDDNILPDLQDEITRTEDIDILEPKVRSNRGRKSGVGKRK